jgi:hypothetical protein
MMTDIELKGKWRIPGDDQVLDGILTYSKNKDCLLETFGSFDRRLFQKKTHDVILGETLEGKVTLYKTTNSGSRTKISNEICISKYRPTIMFLGNHFTTIEDLKFNEITFRLFNLFEWVSNTGLDITSESDDPRKDITISYKQPDFIDLSFSDDFKFKLNFSNPLELYGIQNSVNLSEECDLSFIYNEKKSFDRLLTDMTIFQKFVTLSTFEQSYPLLISFDKSIQCIYSNSYYKEEYKTRRQSESLLNYKLIKDDLPKILKNWFEGHEKLNPSFVLLLNSFINPNSYDNERFLSIMRGLECYHRRTSNETILSEQEFEAKKEQICSSLNLNRTEKVWLLGELQYSNELSLRKRLRQLIETNENKYIENHIKSIKPFCTRVIDHRNYLIHYSKELEDKQIFDMELIDYTNALTGLLISCLMNYLEVDKKVYEEKLGSLLY